LNQALRVAAVLGCVCAAIVALSPITLAQQIDVAVGGGGTSAAKASAADGNHSPESLGGGSYFSASGDVLLHKNVGLEAEVSWRGTRAVYFPGGFNQPYRPFFYDLNGIWAPKLRHRMTAELMAGAGAETTRFYKGLDVCSFTTCTKYVSSNHFLIHFGGGLRYYVFRKFFIRPEAHLYWVHNNVEFSSDRVIRYGASLGYTF
jgi:hypothetical protein